MNVNLGDTIELEDRSYRVVRIITSSATLFEDESGCYVLIESYIQLKGSDNSVRFIELSEHREDYTGKSSHIRALTPIGKE